MLITKFAQAAALALSLAASAHASTSYQFDSSNYTSANAPIDTSMHLTWVVTLDNPLGAGVVTQKIFNLPGATVVWNDGFSNQTATFFQTINLTTNSAGDVVAWDYSFGNNDANVDGNNFPGTSYASIVYFNGPASGFVDSGKGSFTITQSPVTAVPEPETYALFLIGLAALSAVSKRARRTDARSAGNT